MASGRNMAAAAGLSFVLLCGRAAACDCVEPEVVAVDEVERRYFVAISETSEVMIRASVYDLVKAVESRHPAWAGQVNISFFSDARWAGHLADQAERSEWAASYLAEYSQHKATLTFRPEIPEQRTEISLMVVLPPPS